MIESEREVTLCFSSLPKINDQIIRRRLNELRYKSDVSIIHIESSTHCKPHTDTDSMTMKLSFKQNTKN